MCFAAAIAACGPSLDEDTAEAYAALPEHVDYNIDVRPILSDRCWSCHGPDANTREAGLRLDIAEAAYEGAPGRGPAIVPGSRGSELVRRVLSDEAEYRMPTPESHLTLSPRERAVLVKWVEDGAPYDPHWAFSTVAAAKPLRPAAIDSLVRERYAERGLSPVEPAGARELVRRLYRDLTALPPTYRQTRAFVDDPSEERYAALVDSLLATDAHAERLTLEWLDVARYADSHGLHADGLRTSWPWRDWVIEAFRQNRGYDEFVTEQLAGDLIDGATQEEIVATAFNRNHPMTAEGGADHEEFRVQYVMDRTNTFATAFLGLTMECAACHDHKFDPVSQEDYYALSAFFNHVKEFGMTGDDGDYGPLIALMSDSTRGAIADIDRRIHEATPMEGGAARQIAFIEGLPEVARPVAYVPFDAVRGERADGYPDNRIADTLYTVEGITGNAYYLDTEWDAVDVHLPAFEAYEPMSVSLWVKTDKREDGSWQTLLSNAGDKNGYWRGLDFSLTPENRLNARWVHSLPGNYIEVMSIDSLHVGQWHHVGFAYDGSSRAAGVQLYLDGRPARQETVFDKLWKGIHPSGGYGEVAVVERPYRIGRSGRSFTGEAGILRGAVDELKVFDRQLSHLEMAAALPNDRPVEVEANWQEQHEAVLALRRAGPRLRALRRERERLSGSALDLMVMQDMPAPRQAYVLERGNFDQPGKPVDPATPPSVLTFDTTRYSANRLGLAQWLFDADNPLPARVAANRYWQMIMGRGLVATPHDFGMQGDLPSHPALLDYLAGGFRESGWNLRSLLRAIVLSDTYKLSSAQVDEAAAADPDNVYLARASSHRYPAESIRDYALQVSGLLVQDVGGASVRPHQPPGLWREKSTFSKALLEYEPQSGDSLYRRSMYTFIRRTSPPPAMAALDQPSRDRCTVAREETNTPLQALVLLNDPQFVEAARVLAQKVDPGAGLPPERGIDELFRRVLGRDAYLGERAAMLAVYEESLASFATDPAAASELLGLGEYPLPDAYAAAELGALTVTANTILNHDEVYTRR